MFSDGSGNNIFGFESLIYVIRDKIFPHFKQLQIQVCHDRALKERQGKYLDFHTSTISHVHAL